MKEEDRKGGEREDVERVNEEEGGIRNKEENGEKQSEKRKNKEEKEENIKKRINEKMKISETRTINDVRLHPPPPPPPPHPPTTTDPTVAIPSSSVKCRSTNTSELQCHFTNLYYNPRDQEFAFVQDGKSSISGITSIGELRTGLSLSSVARHNAFMFHVTAVPRRAISAGVVKGGSAVIPVISDTSVVFGRFKPDNMHHVFHDDLLPLYFTGRQLCGGGGHECPSMTLIITDQHGPSPHLDLYQALTPHILLTSTLMTSDLPWLRLASARFGLERGSVWYQYGFGRPQGPLPSHLTGPQMRDFAAFMRLKLGVPVSINAATSSGGFRGIDDVIPGASGIVSSIDDVNCEFNAGIDDRNSRVSPSITATTPRKSDIHGSIDATFNADINDTKPAAIDTTKDSSGTSTDDVNINSKTHTNSSPINARTHHPAISATTHTPRKVIIITRQNTRKIINVKMLADAIARELWGQAGGPGGGTGRENRTVEKEGKKEEEGGCEGREEGRGGGGASEGRKEERREKLRGGGGGGGGIEEEEERRLEGKKGRGGGGTVEKERKKRGRKYKRRKEEKKGIKQGRKGEEEEEEDSEEEEKGRGEDEEEEERRRRPQTKQGREKTDKEEEKQKTEEQRQKNKAGAEQGRPQVTQGHGEVKIMSLEKDGILEMIHEVSGADVLIGMHGAALILGLFLPPKSLLVELWPYGIDPVAASVYRAMCGLEGSEITYIAWENEDIAHTRTHAEYARHLGGLGGFTDAERDSITSGLISGRKLTSVTCCEDSDWLFRIYQDTEVRLRGHGSSDSRGVQLKSVPFEDILRKGLEMRDQAASTRERQVKGCSEGVSTLEAHQDKDPFCKGLERLKEPVLSLQEHQKETEFREASERRNEGTPTHKQEQTKNTLRQNTEIADQDTHEASRTPSEGEIISAEPEIVRSARVRDLRCFLRKLANGAVLSVEWHNPWTTEVLECEGMVYEVVLEYSGNEEERKVTAELVTEGKYLKFFPYVVRSVSVWVTCYCGGLEGVERHVQCVLE